MSTAIIPPDAAGFFVIICPTVFYVWGAIEGDYETVVAPIMQDRPGTPDQLVTAAVRMVFRGVMTNTLPEIRDLPLEHPQRQEALWMTKVGASMIASLRREVFFAIVVGEAIADDEEDFTIEALPAQSIAEAQTLIKARSDVQDIDRRGVVQWSPTVRH